MRDAAAPTATSSSPSSATTCRSSSWPCPARCSASAARDRGLALRARGGRGAARGRSRPATASLDHAAGRPRGGRRGRHRSWCPAGTRRDRYVEPELVEALRAAHRRGARLVSVCTGAFALAATGLLDGRRATTHWMHAERARRPATRAITVDPAVLYVDEGSILTSAGTAAGIDLCLHLVRRDLGAEAANTRGPPHGRAAPPRRRPGPVRRRPRCRTAPTTTRSARCSRGWPSTSTSS